MSIDSNYVGGNYTGSFVLVLGVKVVIWFFYAYLVIEFIQMERGKIEYATAHENWRIPVNFSSATYNCYQNLIEDVDWFQQTFIGVFKDGFSFLS